MFQSTHPRRVWRQIPRPTLASGVSIHTPTKGVTRYVRPNHRELPCFNPHTHEGCDFTKLRVLSITKRFQSTHPRRVWHCKGSFAPVFYSFNPHTHEGCDLWYQLGQDSNRCFNPHTHEGCDIALHIIRHVLTSFNPHTHEGCDKSLLCVLLLHCSFNPHTHEGCDYTLPDVSSLTKVFQSTHPRRVWLYVPPVYEDVQHVSIHTPTKGVTVFDLPKRPPSKVSIHTPTKGVTDSIGMQTQYRCVSIHTPTKGVTWCVCFFAEITRVSIHTPTKGVTLIKQFGHDV